ncbi:hypothetical protein Vadar_034472 [Vaccinium darrowii]|uniref:Uncharacterized protein n=1 Tax=Vaccinium darrowii TaxID=229202 RepID=A0ACB7YRV6_9ERIC|nr:hypothetical protein Vadar_034472 [Vaccinium darrowii]
MSLDRPSSSTSEISSAEAKPAVSSVNVHPSSSTSGTPTDAVNSKQNTEDENATTPSFCCIPINTATPAAPESKNRALLQIDKIRKDIDQVQMAYDSLKDHQTGKQRKEAFKVLEKEIEEPLKKQIEEPLKKQIEEARNKVQILADSLSEGPIETCVQEDLNELKKDVKNIRLQILPELKHLISTSKSHTHGKYHTDDFKELYERRKGKNLDKKVPNLYKNEMLACSSEFKDFKELYDGLGSKQKLCLLCFSVFPEKEIIKKRFMFYWWIAEGFVAPVKGSELTAEVLANEVFSELMAKRFIEPFSEKRTLAGWVNKCEMHPFVRAAVITLARRAKFCDFDAEGNPVGNFSSFLLCLLAGEEMQTESPASRCNVHMLFNVDETELNFEKPEVFSRMKNINLLCLGRWQTSRTHHIQVEDTEFLEGLKNMKYLKFLSLQGISPIKNLPTSVSNLTNLMILDVRACPNLEKIPWEIGLLKSLTHLDMSECYLLLNMPKEISMLVELEILKGFVVGNLEGKNQKDSCSLGHLVRLTKLRKLSIFNRLENFPSDSELRDLSQLKKLVTLSIEWGGVLRRNPGTYASPLLASPLLPSPNLPIQLEKLDLRSFPYRDAPKWLMDSKMNKLKKLYIRGGLLRGLGQYGLQEKEWTAEILRLKFLPNLEMDWWDVLKLFPNLIYLEKVRCPKLTFFPCDGQGVWMKNQRN